MATPQASPLAGPSSSPDQVEEIHRDPNFLTLAFSSTKEEAFLKLIEEHVGGYTQKQRVVDGLKSLRVKVEEVESKLMIARSVGKAKALDPEMMSMAAKYDAADLKAKWSQCNELAQAMIENGRLTHKEQPEVLASLRTRLEAAKVAEKAKLQEKLERLIAAALKKKVQYIPVSNIDDIATKRKEFADVEAWEKKPWKSLAAEEQRAVTSKSILALELAAVESKGIMWFETEEEYRPRLKMAVADYERTQVQRRKDEAELIKREKAAAAELALQKQIEEDEKRLEEKRRIAKEKEDQLQRELNAKLEAARKKAEEEALANPKEVAVVEKKKKVRGMKIDAQHLFVAKSQSEIREENPSDEEVDFESESGTTSAIGSALVTPILRPQSSPHVGPSAAPAAEKKEDKKKEEKKEEKKKEKAPPKVKVELENKWGNDPIIPASALHEDEAEDAELPSLAAAAKAPKKTAPQVEKKVEPKGWNTGGKKEKPKATKMDPRDLFLDPRDYPQEDGQKEVVAAVVPAPWAEPKAPAAAPAPAPVAVKVAAPVPVKAQKPKPPPKKELENKWGGVAAAPADAEDGDDVGPSLADALLASAPAAEKKTAPPPKKKEKKKFAKADMSLLGFD